MKIIYIFVLIIISSSCGKIEDNSRGSSFNADVDIIDKPLVCSDFNSLNNNELAPCTCPSEYILSLDTTECVDKQEIPKIIINMKDNAEILHKTWQDATIIIEADSVDETYSGNYKATVRGRGNSTWEFPKKPYRFKLDKNSEILGLPKHKQWVLLANYSDKTLMRVMLANEMGKRLGMDYTPRYKVVELEVNGKFLGTYLLTEQIKIDKNRVNISDNNITGGYIIELDQYKDGDYLFESNQGIPFTVKEPDPPSEAQMDYIENYFNDVENVLFSNNFNNAENGYSSLIDVKSFVDWYLINEILKNSDAGNWSSIYYHKSNDSKLKMGPIWDFDTSSGNNNYTDAEYPIGWWIRYHGIWFDRLFDDPKFELQVKNRYKEFKKLGIDLESLLKFIDQKSYAMEKTQERNFLKWKILDIYVWPNPIIPGTYQGEVDYLKSWLTQRMNWISNEFK